MGQSVTEAIAQIQTWVGGLTGIVEAPESPPESANQYPFAVTYADTGTFTLNTKGWGTGLHTITTEIHFNRQSLPAAIAKALPYLEQYLDLIIADPRMNGTVDTTLEINYEFGQLEYAGTKTIGWLFHVRVKILRSEAD